MSFHELPSKIGVKLSNVTLNNKDLQKILLWNDPTHKMLIGNRLYRTNFSWREQWAASHWLVSWSKSSVLIGRCHLTYTSNSKWRRWQLLLKASLSPSPAAFIHRCFSPNSRLSVMSQNMLHILLVANHFVGDIYYIYPSVCLDFSWHLMETQPLGVQPVASLSWWRPRLPPRCAKTNQTSTQLLESECQREAHHPRPPLPPPHASPPAPPLSPSRSNQSMQGWAAPFVSFCSSNWPPSGKLMTRALLEWLQWGTSRAAWWVRA